MLLLLESDLERLESHKEGARNYTFLINKSDSGFDVVQFTINKNKTVKEQFYYNLKTKEYYFKRNDRVLKFKDSNINPMFYRHGNLTIFLDFISTQSTNSLFKDIIYSLGMLNKELSVNISRAFERLINQYSFYEILLKSNVKIDVNYLDHINTNGNSPYEILNIDKTRWKLISKYSIPWSKLAYKNNNVVADRKANSLMNFVERLNEKYSSNRIEEFIDNEFNHIFGNYGYYSVVSLAELYNLDLKRAIEYIYYEAPLKQDLSIRHTFTLLRDYLMMNRTLGFTNYEKYPKSLKTKHDTVQELCSFQNSELKKKQFEKAKETFSFYAYEYGNYKIIPPNSIDDIINEGNDLSHCVSSYVDKVLNGNSIILFLRSSKNVLKSLATIEISGNELVQARGRFNKKLSESQTKTVDKFIEKFNLVSNYK